MKKNPLEYALFLIKIRDRSIKELKQKMAQKGFESDEIQKVVTKLIEQNILNDQRFAQRLTENYTKYRFKGENAIKMKLIQAGIDSEIIRECLAEIENPESVAEEAAQKWLAKRKEGDEVKLKLMNHLASRGFTYDVIKKVVDCLKI